MREKVIGKSGSNLILKRFFTLSLLVVILNVFSFANGMFSLSSDSTLTITIDSTTAGFVADGKTNNAKAIQAAIDSIANAGGGTLRFVNGRYLTAPFELTGNFTLEIDSEATILASQNVHDYYLPGADTTKPPSSLQNFISADKADDLTITGYGTIDGQGQPWWDTVDAAKAAGISLPLRPRLIEIEHSKHLVITDISIKNAPMFNICPSYCYDVNINHIKIYAPSNSPNTDGIDPGECHHVRISYCTIDNGDDDIAVGASHFDPNWNGAASTDIIISHCTFFHGHGCSIGSYTVGGVDSMLVDSCTFDSTDNGFRIKSNRGRGGDVRHITYKDITMNNVQYPIYLTAYYPSIPSEYDAAQPVNSLTPDYHDISFINITSVNSPWAGLIVGVPELIIKNILLQNVSISATRGFIIRNTQIDTSNVAINVNIKPQYIIETNGTLGPVTAVKNFIAPVKSFALRQNYPNPFNPGTEIDYSIPRESRVTLEIFDMLGREVTTLVDKNEAAGNYNVKFNADNFANGVYFYRLKAGNYTAVRKMILLK